MIKVESTSKHNTIEKIKQNQTLTPNHQMQKNNFPVRDDIALYGNL
jgi:hypothetical protein